MNKAEAKAAKEQKHKALWRHLYDKHIAFFSDPHYEQMDEFHKKHHKGKLPKWVKPHEHKRVSR